jgi:single-strand DNA-binding protein
MNYLNSILLEGMLTGNPVMGYTKKGTAVCSFTLKSERLFLKGEETTKETLLVEVQVIGKLAEVCGEYLKKGREVRVVGWLKEEDQKVFIVGEHVEFKSKRASTLDEVNERRAGKA